MNRQVKKIWIRLTQWEFWPFAVLYFPVNFYYIWLALKSRSFFFFTASNPAIDFGGMLGESKAEILELIPKEYLPRHVLVKPGDLHTALTFAQNIGYPVIAKPDVGERGKLVEKIKSAGELESYMRKCQVPFLIQEFIDWPVELGVFYVRLPGESSGKVTSLVQKDFLTVTGDGSRTVKQLLEGSPRALLQLDWQHPRFAGLLASVPGPGAKVLVEPIGNHCRGTIFLDQHQHIDTALSQAFDAIADGIPNFYFGRFDLRCRSIEDLKQLKNFKILELNGAGAEPGHIYQPGYSLLKAYRSIFWHLNVLAQISRINKENGHPFWTFRQGMRKLRGIRQYNKMIREIK